MVYSLQRYKLLVLHGVARDDRDDEPVCVLRPL